MAERVLRFDEALDDSRDRFQDTSVLLGNGFSMSWDPDVFGYNSLFEEAEFRKLSVGKVDLFDALDTRDFEAVVEYLESAATLSKLYETMDKRIATRMRRDARIVRRGLADVLTARHPDKVSAVSDSQLECARRFLSNFDHIYSLNYDLLMYWAVNARRGTGYQVVNSDGFEWPSRHGPYDTHIWKRDLADRSQKVFHLHGALHLYVGGDKRLHKMSYQMLTPIVDQVRERLENGKYPLVVTEGRSAQKLARVERSAYLRYCAQRLADQAGSLFVYGCSFSDNDEHIWTALEDNASIRGLYVSVFGPKGDRGRTKVIERARDIRAKRTRRSSLRLKFFEAESARVWSD